MKCQSGAALLFALLSSTALAADSKDTIDEIVVAGHRVTTDTVEVLVDQQLIVDTAMSLKDLPGADVNSNGSITGIAQYRGMYGDRVAITIDRHAIISGGPNSMDAPLSYVPPMITESIVVERGIASVSSAPESIGGHLSTSLARGDFGGDEASLSGFLGTRYATNGSLRTSAGRLTLADSSHRLTLLAELDDGADIDTPDGVIRPSALDRQRYDLSYAYSNENGHIAVFAGRALTNDSGTPALPMDIGIIDTDLLGTHFLYGVSSSWTIEGRMSVNDVYHEMDNFSLRAVGSPTMQRMNTATGKGQSFALAGAFDRGNSTLRFGVDGILAKHDALITNPANAAFMIQNFNAVERDLISAFIEWQQDFESAEFELGFNLKQVDVVAGEVDFAGMMNPSAAMLRNAFNAADRDLSYDDFDAVAKFRLHGSDNVEWLAEIARKSRAPSYQELFLWLPLQATGGLADGRSYIGDLGLESEKSSELNLGVFVSTDRFSVSPQLFYKQLDGYIQGVPSTNAAANMVATMMTGQPALQFSNTDAEIWGIDVAWDWQLNEHLSVDGVATYSRGQRTDVADDLYRLAPANGSLGLTYARGGWSASTRVVAYARQDKVAIVNDEQATPSYEIVNARFDWQPMDSLRLEAHVQNLFDSRYRDHLAGINRAAGSDIVVGAALPGRERSVGVGVIVSF